jgi:hypothetical protein
MPCKTAVNEIGSDAVVDSADKADVKWLGEVGEGK